MRVAVDADLCAGYGVCVGHAPEVFDLTPDGYTVARVDEVSAEQASAVRLAAAECPTGAITITDEEDERDG